MRRQPTEGLAADESLGPPTTRGLVTTKAMGARVRNHRGGKTTTGIIRNLDELGRIVIPIEIRKRFGLTERDPLEISVRDQAIILSRPRTTCVFCGTTRAVSEHRGRGVCRTCVAELAAS